MAYDALTTLEDAKIYLKIPQSVTSEDAAIEGLILELSDQIGRTCGRDNLGAVLSYSERIVRTPNSKPWASQLKLMLRNYPVANLQSVQFGFDNQQVTNVPVTTNLFTTSGAMMDPNDKEQRTLLIIGYQWMVSGPLVIQYTAGYVGFDVPSTPTTIPPGLQRVAKQWIDEIRKAKDHTGYKSQTLAGQTVTWEPGQVYGMSPRTLAMLQPYINRVPPYG